MDPSGDCDMVMPSRRLPSRLALPWPVRISDWAFPLFLITLISCSHASAGPEAGGGRGELRFVNTPMARAIILKQGAKVARNTGPDGASRGASKNFRRGRVAVETQRDAYYAVAAAVASNGPERDNLLDRGLKAYEWGFAQAGPDGSFPRQAGKGEGGGHFHALHNKAQFLQAAGRGLILLREATVAEPFRRREKALEASLLRSANWLAASQDLTEFRSRAANSNQRLVVATALQQAAVLGEDSRLQEVAQAMVAEVIARQMADGVLPERGGFDAHYQSYSTEMLARYASLLPAGAWHSRVEVALDRAIRRWVRAIRPDGTLDTSGNTRTAACGPAMPGQGPKSKRADKLPLRLAYLDVMTDGRHRLSTVAARVERAGQTFRHRERCPSQAASPEPD